MTEDARTYGSAHVDLDTAERAYTLYTSGLSMGQVADAIPAIGQAVPGGMYVHRATWAQEVIQDYVGYLMDLPPRPDQIPAPYVDTPTGQRIPLVCHTPPPRPTLRQRLIRSAVQEYNRRMNRSTQ